MINETHRARAGRMGFVSFSEIWNKVKYLIL